MITIIQGDITTLAVDAIVNAANQVMLGGGDGAIHRAAGPELYEACLKVPEVRPSVRCPMGEARITPGFKLPAKFVIHTVGPVYRDGQHGEPEKAEGEGRAPSRPQGKGGGGRPAAADGSHLLLVLDAGCGGV